MTKTVIFILIQTFLLIYNFHNEVKQRFHSKTLPTWATSSFHVQVKQEHRSSQTSCDLIKTEVGICNPTEQICRDVHLLIPQILTMCQFPMRTMDKVPSDWPGAASCFRWQGFRTPRPYLSTSLPSRSTGEAPPTKYLELFHFPFPERGTDDRT